LVLRNDQVGLMMLDQGVAEKESQQKKGGMYEN
jgi:hypothetical protein